MMCQLWNQLLSWEVLDYLSLRPHHFLSTSPTLNCWSSEAFKQFVTVCHVSFSFWDCCRTGWCAPRTTESGEVRLSHNCCVAFEKSCFTQTYQLPFGYTCTIRVFDALFQSRGFLWGSFMDDSGWLQLSLLATCSGSSNACWRICAAMPTCSLAIVLALSDALGQIQIMVRNLLQNGVLRLHSASSRYAVHNRQPRHEPGPASPVGPCQWVLPMPYYAVFFCWEIAYHYDQLRSFLQIHSFVCSRCPAACLMNLLLYFSRIRSPAMTNSLFWIIADRYVALQLPLSGDCTVRCHRHAFCSTKSQKVAAILSMLEITYKSFIFPVMATQGSVLPDTFKQRVDDWQ